METASQVTSAQLVGSGGPWLKPWRGWLKPWGGWLKPPFPFRIANVQSKLLVSGTKTFVRKNALTCGYLKGLSIEKTCGYLVWQII